MEGTDVDQYILYNNKGIEVSVIIYGGIITSWTAAKKMGITWM
jgi:aldose 1-epimerase